LLYNVLLMAKYNKKIKINIIKAYRVGSRVSDLAVLYGVSRPQIYRWINAYLEHGKKSLTVKSTKPRKSPTRTSTQLERKILKCKENNLTWSPNKIAIELTNAGSSVSRPTVVKVLEKHGKNEKYTMVNGNLRRKINR